MSTNVAEDIARASEPNKMPSNSAQALRSFLITLMKREDFKNKLGYLEDIARKQYGVLRTIWEKLGTQDASLISRFLTTALGGFQAQTTPPNVTKLLETILGTSDQRAQVTSLNSLLCAKPEDQLRNELAYLNKSVT